MSREHDAKIAEWLGWELDTSDKNYPIWFDRERRYRDQLPYYTTSDSAITLLPELVERGYGFEMATSCYIVPTRYDFRIHKAEQHKITQSISVGKATTISAAISSAVLELIEKEGEGMSAVYTPPDYRKMYEAEKNCKQAWIDRAGRLEQNLRDQLAMAALSGLIQQHEDNSATFGVQSTVEALTKSAYRYADAMLKEREK